VNSLSLDRDGSRKFDGVKVTIGILQQTTTCKLIIPALGRQNKGKSSFSGSGLFVLMSQCGNNNQLAHHHVPCDRFLQKAYCPCCSQRNKRFHGEFRAAKISIRGVLRTETGLLF